jgi:hypothetical protein
MIQQYRNQQSFLYGNKIWIGKEIIVDQEYKDVVEINFGSEILNIDFETIGAVDDTKLNNTVHYVNTLPTVYTII